MLRRAHHIREAIAIAVSAQLISRKDNRVRLVAARGYPSWAPPMPAPLLKPPPRPPPI